MKNAQMIEGLPPGVRVDRIGPIRTEDYGRMCLGSNGTFYTAMGPVSHTAYIFVSPDNIYQTLDLAQVPLPDGWERAPEPWHRVARPGEFWLGVAPEGKVRGGNSCVGSAGPVIVMRPKKVKRQYITGRWPVSDDFNLNDYAALVLTSRQGPNLSLSLYHAAIETVEE